MTKEKQKPHDCKTCREKQTFQEIDICSLRVFSLDDLQAPPQSSICEYIKFCNFYRKDK